MTKTINISQEKFFAYEKVRRSGKTNMWDVQRVVELSKKVVTQEDCLEIMQNYSVLKDTYLKR